ncbi:MAG: branched-chain amino acid ABC transporter permease [Candidatus Rokuibacteriota bacterium]|nr:MAG: branched-chain amino acid ABC transporter permease [Candidatus Rokubacteria bacterium]
MGRAVGGLERGRRLRRAGLARPCGVLRRRGLLGRAGRRALRAQPLARPPARRGAVDRRRRPDRLPLQPAQGALLRAVHDRLLPGAADRGQPLARVHCYAVEVYLERSRRGYQLAGVREDEDAAEALGIATRRLKVWAVTLSAALTSVGGSLWAQYVGFVDPAYVFSIDLSVRFALNTIIGGMGTALGPWLGSILITSLETYLRATFAGMKTGFAGIYLIIYGVVLILVVRFVPEGLVGLAGRLRTRVAGASP